MSFTRPFDRPVPGAHDPRRACGQSALCWRQGGPHKRHFVNQGQKPLLMVLIVLLMVLIVLAATPRRPHAQSDKASGQGAFGTVPPTDASPVAKVTNVVERGGSSWAVLSSDSSYSSSLGYVPRFCMRKGV